MSKVELDNPASYGELDRSDLYRSITEFPQQMHDAWNLAGLVRIPERYRQARNAVVLGMGGSAIGGSLLQSYAGTNLTMPLEVWRNYGVPGYVNDQTLVFAVSFSGGTEETLSGLRAAYQRNAMVVAITTGGQVAELAQEWGFPVVQFAYMAQPRTALGYLFVPLLRLALESNVIGGGVDIEEAIQAARTADQAWGAAQPTEHNLAKQLALACRGRIPVIYGAEHLAAVAHRWKTQINENADGWAFYEVFPELNHNAVVGYTQPPDAANAVEVVVLESTLFPPRIQTRIQVTSDLLQRAGVHFSTVQAQGESVLSQMISTIALGDYVSYYLALLNGVDPTVIEPITLLKRALAQAG